jgi:hypothetical protein
MHGPRLGGGAERLEIIGKIGAMAAPRQRYAERTPLGKRGQREFERFIELAERLRQAR